jgi:hypothetical protein
MRNLSAYSVPKVPYENFVRIFSKQQSDMRVYMKLIMIMGLE